jgi:hypothetical protein
MEKAEEFRRHADECRVLARGAQNNEHRLQLLKMAESWEELATAREQQVLKRTKTTSREGK